ncbi:hypothetical protein CC78DRAFT_581987 [Lojkania enalia]|uniref:Uncharacterized protein n=1 Tax=Lojkania enalia TaxID=147567 RepID=A0A9P4N573_9PLEO|nr:hypothetical protein CC78DRAFT_581987 [Didymosphaeria enalia]
MLSFATLLILIQTVHAQSPTQTLTPTRTSIITTLLMPYGPSAAAYEASIAAVSPFGTVYALTCSSPPTATLNIASSSPLDPCQTNRFGPDLLIITQGRSTWQFSHAYQGTTFFTQCGVTAGWKCYGWEGDSRALYVTTAGEAAALGLGEGKVTVTGGWEMFDFPDGKGPSSTSSEVLASFTDIGAEPTDGPVVTVTLRKIHDGAGLRGVSIGKDAAAVGLKHNMLLSIFKTTNSGEEGARSREKGRHGKPNGIFDLVRSIQIQARDLGC